MKRRGTAWAGCEPSGYVVVDGLRDNHCDGFARMSGQVVIQPTPSVSIGALQSLAGLLHRLLPMQMKIEGAEVRAIAIISALART